MGQNAKILSKPVSSIFNHGLILESSVFAIGKYTNSYFNTRDNQN